MCCKRDETRMESSLHAVDMPTNGAHEHEPSTNDESAPTRRCARWLGRLNGWTASAVDLEQGGGRQKAGALDIPNDGGNRFYVSTKFAFSAIGEAPHAIGVSVWGNPTLRPQQARSTDHATQ